MAASGIQHAPGFTGMGTAWNALRVVILACIVVAVAELSNTLRALVARDFANTQ